MGAPSQGIIIIISHAILVATHPRDLRSLNYIEKFRRLYFHDETLSPQDLLKNGLPKALAGADEEGSGRSKTDCQDVR